MTQAYSDDSSLTKNDACESAVTAALDAADSVLRSFAILEQYITLTVPKMEDGGNFGVSVQLSAIKVIADATKKIEDGMEELYKYASARADAMEKCKQNPSVTTTKTTTATQSNTTGNDSEKGDTQNNSNAQSNEEKTIQTSINSIETQWRQRAVTAVDVRFYGKAKAVRILNCMGRPLFVCFTHHIYVAFSDFYQCHHGVHGSL